MMIINPYRFGGYDARYQAWLDELTAQSYTHPTAAMSAILNTMLKGIYDDGNFSILDRFWFMANNGSENTSRVCMINPSGHTQPTLVNSPGWTAKQGINSNGTSSYWNLQFALSSLTNYQQNDAGIGWYMHTASNTTSGGNYVFGAATTSPQRLTATYDQAGQVLRALMNNAITGDFAITSTAAFVSGHSYGMSRTASTGFNYYDNGTSVQSLVVTSTAPPTVNVFALSGDSDGSPANYAKSDWKLSCIWFGSGSVSQAQMHSRISTAMTAIAALP